MEGPEVLFVATAFLFQIVLIVHYALRKWRFYVAARYGPIVYALSLPAFGVSMLILVAGRQLRGKYYESRGDDSSLCSRTAQLPGYQPHSLRISPGCEPTLYKAAPLNLYTAEYLFQTRTQHQSP